MEIAININPDLLNEALLAADGRNQEQLIEDALKLFVFHNKQDKSEKYRRKIPIKANPEALRKSKCSLMECSEYYY